MNESLQSFEETPLLTNVFNRLLMGSFLSLLFSCSSVPLSSMIKMVTLDSDDIVKINPAEVRVKLSLTEPVELQTKDVQLVLQLEHFDKSKSEYKYNLEIIDTKLVKPLVSFFSTEPAKHAYQFKLARLSQLEFNKYQKEFADLGKPKRYFWTVYYYLKKTKEKVTDINIDMELKLSKNDDYFYLLKNAPVEVK